MTTVEAIKHLFIDTGAGWVLWLLGALSVASVAIAVERWLVYKTRTGDLRALAETLHRHLEHGDHDGAVDALASSPATAARIAVAGLRLARLGANGVDKAIRSRTALEREELERRLAFLGTLGNNAPFLGLFGTVIGIIQAFEELGHSAPGHASAASSAGQVASQAVMTALAEALVATAVGIAVALPAVALFNYLQRRVETLLSGADVLSNLVLAYLSDLPPTIENVRRPGAEDPSNVAPIRPRSGREGL